MKIHTRVKRNIKGGTHLRHKRRDRKSHRMKTFKSEEKAVEHAKKMGIANYELVNLKSEDNKEKKIKIVRK